jgi:hypothetical protein
MNMVSTHSESNVVIEAECPCGAFGYIKGIQIDRIENYIGLLIGQKRGREMGLAEFYYICKCLCA